MPTEQPDSGRRDKGAGFSWRLALLLALALYGIIFVAVNSESVDVSFVIFSTHASLVVVILLALAIGFLAGFLFDTVRERRRRGSRS